MTALANTHCRWESQGLSLKTRKFSVRKSPQSRMFRYQLQLARHLIPLPSANAESFMPNVQQTSPLNGRISGSAQPVSKRKRKDEHFDENFLNWSVIDYRETEPNIVVDDESKIDVTVQMWSASRFSSKLRRNEKKVTVRRGWNDKGAMAVAVGVNPRQRFAIVAKYNHDSDSTVIYRAMKGLETTEMLRLAHKEYDVAPFFEVLLLKPNEILTNIWLLGKHKQGPGFDTDATAEVRVVHNVAVMDFTMRIADANRSKDRGILTPLSAYSYQTPALRCYILFQTNAPASLPDSTAKDIQTQKREVFLDEEMSMGNRLGELGFLWPPQGTDILIGSETKPRRGRVVFAQPESGLQTDDRVTIMHWRKSRPGVVEVRKEGSGETNTSSGWVKESCLEEFVELDGFADSVPGRCLPEKLVRIRRMEQS
jgi:hypothetical protein